MIHVVIAAEQNLALIRILASVTLVKEIQRTLKDSFLLCVGFEPRVDDEGGLGASSPNCSKSASRCATFPFLAWRQ